MAEKAEKFVLAEESSASEEEEEGDFDITTWTNTQLVPETQQLYDDAPKITKPLPSPSPPKTSSPQPSTATPPDVIEELMTGSRSTPSVTDHVPSTLDVLEELMFGSSGTSSMVETSSLSRHQRQQKKHCKTCTCKN